MSKTLNRQQRKWTTTERECYAIYMALRKFEYLIRDVPFELFTDHENLVYLNTPPSNKVLRWKLAIQEYNIFIDYIKGELNVVADGLSRLTDEVPTTKDSWPVSTDETLQGVEEVVRIPLDENYETLQGAQEVERFPSHDSNAASRGPVGIGTEPPLPNTNRKKTRRRRKREGKMDQEVTDLERSVDSVVTPLDTSSALSRIRDQMDIDAEDATIDPTVRMLTNLAFTPVEQARTETPSHGIDDGRTTTRTQQPHVEELTSDLQPPMTGIVTTLSDEPDMAVSSVPNGKNTIPGTDANMKSDDNDRTMRRVPSGTNIAPEHRKWFTAVHNCWMGHRGVSATLDSLRQKQCIWNTIVV